MLENNSPILCQGRLAELPGALQRSGLRNWHVITDSNLRDCLSWEWCRDQEPIVVPAGEKSKSLEQAAELYSVLARRGVTRNTAIVAVGGGVVGDLAGFVAATCLRGLPLVQVPTSLVAQVDSSLGGKVGVDLPEGKNLVGAFYPARLIYLDTELLESLPVTEWNAGMAEVLKHALLDGPEHWSALESLSYPLSSASRQEVVLRSRQVKLDVVALDPFEQNVRAHLNLGHTLAHAIESAQQYGGWNHGEAVGFGLRAALRLSSHLLQMDPTWEERLVVQLQRYELPVRRPAVDWDSLIPFIRRDKKNSEGRLRFVLLRCPGEPQISEEVDWALLRRVWEELA